MKEIRSGVLTQVSRCQEVPKSAGFSSSKCMSNGHRQCIDERTALRQMTEVGGSINYCACIRLCVIVQTSHSWSLQAHLDEQGQLVQLGICHVIDVKVRGPAAASICLCLGNHSAPLDLLLQLAAVLWRDLEGHGVTVLASRGAGSV